MLILEASKALDELRDSDIIVVDTETSGLHPWRDGKILAGLGVKAIGGSAFYLPVRHTSPWAVNAPVGELEKLVGALRGKRLVGHNVKFDMAVLYQEGFDLSEEDWSDTMVAARLCYEDEPSYGLEHLCAGMDYQKVSSHEKAARKPQVVLDPDASSERERIQKVRSRIRKALNLRKVDQVSYDMIPPEELEPYCSKDLCLAERLYLHCMRIIEERGLVPLWELEKRVTRVLFDMERHGFKLDVEYVKAEYRRTAEILEDIKQKIEKIAGRSVNFNDPRDVGKAMRELGISSAALTNKGNESWSKSVLSNMDHPLAKLILDARSVYKIRKSYYESFLDTADREGVIHTSVNQSGARTGRMSAREPNLQNIPRFENLTAVGRFKQKEQIDGIDDERPTEIETELLGRVRGAFVPRPGTFLAFFDWSQIELRIFADYAGEKELLKLFDYGLDIHKMTALSAFGALPENEESEEFKWFRNMGKQIAFGLIYGMGVKLLASELGEADGQARAQKVMDTYFSRFRNARRFIDRVHQIVYERGYLKNRWGRRRYLPPEKAYVGVNFLVQGTAADLMKDALDRVWRSLKSAGLKSQPLVPVHDEIIVEIPYDEAEQAIELVAHEMSYSPKLRVPLLVNVEWSPTRWSEKRKLVCSTCKGTGVRLNVDQNELLHAMYRADHSFMETVTVSQCPSCNGKKLDLSDIRKVYEGFGYIS